MEGDNKFKWIYKWQTNEDHMKMSNKKTGNSEDTFHLSA